MKFFKITLLLAFTIVVLYACNNSKIDKVTNAEDYDTYLTPNSSKLNTAKEDLAFWQEKLKNQPGQYVLLAQLSSAQNTMFNLTGNVQYLVDAGKSLEQLNEKSSGNNANYLRAYAKNCISQHQFQKALKALKLAEEEGSNLNATNKMLFDTYLELGNNEKAEYYLANIKDKTQFDYRIRLSKWHDHNGDLKGAIDEMERAVRLAETSNSNELKQWAYTNLADFYGHAGRIQDSYNNYLKALKIEPTNAYALKGIAWIVYSYERDADEAERILGAITQYHKSPNYYLLKAEIAEFKGNSKEQANNMQAYNEMLKNAEYGDMYNTYNIEVLTASNKNLDEALKLALKEVEERPTPQSYSLLAWTYFKKGEHKKALEIVEKNVADKTTEPAVQLVMANIYKANGNNEKLMALKEDLTGSGYELGPLAEKEIAEIY